MLPSHYIPARLGSVGRPGDDLGSVGLAVASGGDARAHRFRLDLAEAERMALALLDAVAVQRHRAEGSALQALISSGSPSADGSPHEGQAQ